METYQSKSPQWELYIIYLRKSRQDDPNETVEEVLSKHEALLQEYAQREFGGKIPEENIYREVGSGESIESREEVKRVLARIEDPTIKGVLVVEPSRLSRGDLLDCGRLINDFRFTKTLVVTPMMTYDLENKMERKFFQDELLRGNDYLEYTKEILLRGRVASVKRGCYIGRLAPYGYKKVKIGKDSTLEPNEEEAEIVRLVFQLYTKENMTPGRIAKKLNEMGVPAPKGEKWVKCTIRQIVQNKHYAGKVIFNRTKKTTVIENGEKIVRRLRQPEEDVIVIEGKHPALIDPETWETACKLVARHPKVRHMKALKNVFAGVLVCSKCGRTMRLHPYKHTMDRYECTLTPKCFKSIRMDELDAGILAALEEAELPALELKVKNGDGDALKIQQKLLTKLEKQMEEYRDQEEKQFELLETGRYTQDLFDRRNAILRDKMDDCQKQIYQARATMPKDVDYAERVMALKEAIRMLKDPEASVESKSKVVRAIVERIEYSGEPSDGLNRVRNRRNHNPFNIKVFLRL